MNERVVPGAPQLDVPGEPVQFPGAPPAEKRRPRVARVWLVATLLSLLLVLAVAAVWWSSGAKNAVRYTTVPVTRGAVAPAVTATGTVNPELTIIVGTYVSGVIQQLYCDYNTQVKTGQVCAKIDPRPYQTLVDQAKANLAVAKAQLEKDKASLNYARIALERATRLVKTNAISKDAFDSATSTYDQAQAQILFDEATIQQRQSALDAAQVNLDYTDIVSPVDGTVVSRNVTMGQTVAASFQTPTLFLIASDLARMQVDTNVSESDIGDVKIGDKATFTVDAFTRRSFHGTVGQVRQSPQTIQNVVTYDVVIAVDNSDLALKPGMTAATRIMIDQRDDVVRVPNAALRYRPGGLAGGREADQARVFVLRDGEPVAVPVVAGLEDDSFTEIVGGEVKPGDRVVTAEQAGAAGRTAMPRLRF
jgi:HlyD family secretion protein